MDDFLNRKEAPLSENEWSQLDQVAVETVRRQLVGRRFIKVFGPVGFGVQTVPSPVFPKAKMGEITELMGDDISPVQTVRRVHLPVATIYKDFWLYGQDLENSHRFGLPLDLSATAAASAFVAQREDDLVLNGHQQLGLPGLTNVDGRQVLPMSDWTQVGAAFQDAVKAMETLVAQGYRSPFAMVTSPTRYANMARVYENTGVLEIEQVRKIMNGGVFHTPALSDGVVVVASLGAQNFDLIVVQDITIAYLTQQNLNHPFRVLESVVLTIHQPGAICTLAGSKSKR